MDYYNLISIIIIGTCIRNIIYAFPLWMGGTKSNNINVEQWTRSISIITKILYRYRRLSRNHRKVVKQTLSIITTIATYYHRSWSLIITVALVVAIVAYHLI